MFNSRLLTKTTRMLFAKQHTIAVAESVTAGLLQAALASANNASVFFQGGITVYNAKQKYTHLHVNLQHALSCNCVSKTIAEQMAAAVARSFGSDWGIGITGYAAPLPGHDMDILFAYYALCFRNEVLQSGEITAANDTPLAVQLLYVNTLLQHLQDALVKTG